MIRSKKKAMWLFAGGAMQEIAAKAIVARGLKLILTDRNSKCVCAKYAEEFINLDTFDIKGNLKMAKKLNSKYKIRAVFTSAADCHETVAHIAKFLKLPGLSPALAHICRYKFELRKKLKKAGIPQPIFKIARTVDEVKKVVKEIPFPFVLKSSNSSGSRGFAKITCIDDINNGVFANALENGTTGYIIVEEMLNPIGEAIPEQSVETLWANGKMYWLNWVDRLFRNDLDLFKGFGGEKNYKGIGWGVELAHINPAVHDIEIKIAIKELIYKAGVAIGIHKEKGSHILKADIMQTKKGPFILELTPRLSGGWDSSMTTPLRGADFIGGAISLALGEKLSLDLWHRYFEYKNPNLFASVFALVDANARDSINRKFAAGTSFDREESLKIAYHNLKQKRYLPIKSNVRMEQ